MKKTLLTLLTLIAICSNTTIAQEWKMVWNDEFNNKTLDTTVWTKIPRGTADWNNYMASYDELYKLKNGVLTLKAVENKRHKADTAKYLTGGIYTLNKKPFPLGRVEIMARVGAAKGFWPAIWMLPQGAKWPLGGEIDIMEHLNFDSIVYQTVHSQYTLKHGIKDNPLYSRSPKYNPNEWNLYVLERHQDSLVFYVNDTKTHVYPRIQTDVEEQFPFADRDFYLLIDSQLGGGWVGPIDAQNLPTQMEIDYVRFYTKNE